MEQEKRPPEEYAVVLDFLPNGYPFDKRPSHKKSAIVQALGTSRFTILELTPKDGVFLQPHQMVYIGEGKRDQIQHVLGRLPLGKLTHTGKAELDIAVGEAISKNEKPFVEFFNKAQPLTTRMHQLELLPGVGKKHMWEIIEARQQKPFESLSDIKARVRLLPDPRKVITRRILMEILDEDKRKIFTD